MAELDKDVHDNTRLSESEVAAAIGLLGSVPHSVFLPCFGTGRHIAPLLALGVKRIVGVDLSPACVEKAKRIHGRDFRVSLHIGDLGSWRSHERFDACILLGNSFGDIVNTRVLERVTLGMVEPVISDGAFLMDYIGEGYLDRCGTTTRWESNLGDTLVFDDRTPRYDPRTGVMSIDVRAASAEDGDLIWSGCYQKIVLSQDAVREHFARVGVEIAPLGLATTLNSYYLDHEGNLGMIARSTWWIGRSMSTS
jgi:hypothetical protein